MAFTRREVLWGIGGGLTGLAATPLPWKLLDDLSIWTQHRGALPVPPQGEVTYRETACSLCPAGCALRMRLVGGRPVSAVGARHPLGNGACALGLTVHHLALHPLRIGRPAQRRADGRLEPVGLDVAVARIAGAMAASERAQQAILVVDQRPGRALSASYAEFLGKLANGIYLGLAGEAATLAEIQDLFGIPAELGIDLERTRTLLSFGAPILDGWGRPGRVLARRTGLRLVQVDGWRSPTAAQADEWLPIRPGGEGPLALALAHVLVRDGLAALKDTEPLVDFAPAAVAPLAGVNADRIEALARSLVSRRPAVAVGGGDPGGGPLAADDERAIALLNAALGSLGVAGGVVPRARIPVVSVESEGPWFRRFASVADASVGVLLLDGADCGRALPWSALHRKLAPGALVVSLSPFLAGWVRHADLLIPGPAPLEDYAEVLASVDMGVAAYGLGAPVLVPPEGVCDPARLLTLLADTRGISLAGSAAHTELLKRRVAAIHSLGRGKLLVRQDGAFAEARPASAEEMWQGLSAGGCWVDDPLPPGLGRLRLSPAWPDPAVVARWTRALAQSRQLTLITCASRGAVGSAPVSPLLSKLYQESDLRPSAGQARVNPATAGALALPDGQRVRLKSVAGTAVVRLLHDPHTPPDRVVLSAGPDPAGLHPESQTAANDALALASAAADESWRQTRVQILGAEKA